MFPNLHPLDLHHEKAFASPDFNVIRFFDFFRFFGLLVLFLSVHRECGWTNCTTP
jgi:hypothetical protein